jgi:hypothetical protein
MKKKKVLSRKRLPTRSPVGMALVLWLMLDRLKAPGWAYGVGATLMAICLAAFIASYWTENEYDPFVD